MRFRPAWIIQPCPSHRRPIGEDVSVNHQHDRFVDGRPEFDRIAENTCNGLGVSSEPCRGIRIFPATGLG